LFNNILLQIIQTLTCTLYLNKNGVFYPIKVKATTTKEKIIDNIASCFGVVLSAGTQLILAVRLKSLAIIKKRIK